MKQLKTVDIKGKAYVTVNERIKYFREPILTTSSCPTAKYKFIILTREKRFIFY